MSVGGIILVALAVAVGMAGIVVPLLPGTLLVFGAIAVWAVVEQNVTEDVIGHWIDTRSFFNRDRAADAE